MTNERTEYAEKLLKFIIGEEMKIKRTKGEKVKLKELGVGHLSEEAKGQSVKSGKREYASGTISKANYSTHSEEGNTKQDAHNYIDKKRNSGAFYQWTLEFSKLMDEGNKLFQEIWDEQPFEGKDETNAELKLGQLMDEMQKDYGFRDYS